MKGLDTNVLVRYLTQDDPFQSRAATELIERRLTQSEPGFVSLVTMVESVWVLKRVYGFSNDEIARAIEGMLRSDTLLIQNEQEGFMAMAVMKTARGSFADALVSALGTWAGCTATVTFDRRAARLAGFELL